MNETILTCNGKNIFIINKKPQFFSTLTLSGSEIALKSDSGSILQNTPVTLGKNIYACLYCDKLKNITLIVKEPDPYTASIIFSEESVYKEALKSLKKNAPSLLFSPQNEKINGYAAGITEKLAEGIEIKIIDAQKEDSIVYCPLCGTQCDPGIPYCMECGAEL